MCAVAAVALVMIDVDREAAVQPFDAGARQVAGLHDDQRVGVVGETSRAISMRSTPGNSR